MKKLILTIFLVLISNTVLASNFIIHTHTFHVGDTKEINLNSFTPGIGYENDNNYRFGILKNSFGVPSIYAVKTFPENASFRFGVGVITGYKWENGLKEGRNNILPLLGAEYDVLDNVSVIWFGQAINVILKW